GLIDTPLTRHRDRYAQAGGDFKSKQPTAALEAEAKIKLIAKSPFGIPWIEPEEISPAVVFLASDPGRLSPRPASLGRLRLAMAGDRAIRGSPARSPCQERDCQRTSDPRDEMRALRKVRRDYPKDAYVFVSERGGPISPIDFHRLIQRLGEAAKMPFPIH